MLHLDDTASYQDMLRELFQAAEQGGDTEEVYYLIIRKTKTNHRGTWEIVNREEYNKPYTPGYLAKVEYWEDRGGWLIFEAS